MINLTPHVNMYLAQTKAFDSVECVKFSLGNPPRSPFVFLWLNSYSSFYLNVEVFLVCSHRRVGSSNDQVC